MSGYDEKFLKVKVALPTFSPELSDQVLKNATLRGGIYADHVNYSVVMNKERRSPIFAALNIDQKLMRTVAGRAFRLDPNVGKGDQLGGKYYDDNPYDKGHLAMRQNAAWGDSVQKAKHASDETFYYSNASLQHQNFNRDEWVSLEKWVGSLSLDLDDKISSVSGPIYGNLSRVVKPLGLEMAEVPAAFFKVIFFVNKESKKLDVRAFIVVQDQAAMANLEGRKIYNAQSYQTTVAEIQEKTGLRFEGIVAEKNPLLYTDKPERRRDFGISHFPERIEVDRPEEIIDGTKRRIYDAEDELDVFIAAALVNPKGRDRGREWISILNLENRAVDMSDWTIRIIPNHKVKSKGKWPELNLGAFFQPGQGKVASGEAIKVIPLNPLQLHNDGATIVLLDEQGRQIDRVKYERKDVKSGVPVKLYEFQP